MRDMICGQLAILVDARITSGKRGNAEWYSRHEDAITAIMRRTAPSGSGIDSGTKIDLTKSTGEKLVFSVDFHHMDENGYYSGWTQHTITCRASLIHGILLTISGPNRNDIKDYLYDVYNEWLMQKA